MMALVLTVSAQAQQDDGYDEMVAAMVAAKVHQDSIDVSSLVAVYNYECRTQDADGKAVTDRMKVCLMVGQHCTRSFPYRKFCKERLWAEGERQAGADFLRLSKGEFIEGIDFGSSEELPLLRTESYCYVPQVWTNYPDGQVTVRDAIPPTIYEAQEECKPIDWTLSDDTVTIGGYRCKTATCHLHGRKWTAHYAEDIPTSAGPWKLCGLPGLILAAEADGGVHRFTLADITRTVAPIYYETSAITMKTSEAELIQMRMKTFGNRLYVENPWSQFSDYSTADIVYDNGGMLINGVYIHDKPHVFQPLELE